MYLFRYFRCSKKQEPIQHPSPRPRPETRIKQTYRIYTVMGEDGLPRQFSAKYYKLKRCYAVKNINI